MSVSKEDNTITLGSESSSDILGSNCENYKEFSVCCTDTPKRLDTTVRAFEVGSISCGPWIRAADYCKQKIEKNIVSSVLFNSQSGATEEEADCMALFQFNEISLGQLLGQGEFSNVFEIVSFCKKLSSKEKNSGNMSSQQEHAQNFLTKNARREKTNKSRYAIKFLKENLLDEPDKFVAAAGDLALEAQFLSSLSHANIIKVRGWSADGTDGFITGRNKGYFLILDCLDETLETRISKWAKEDKKYKHNHLRILWNRNVSARQKLFADRLKVAYDITGAMTYLHKLNIIYRDLKPANLGFDLRGDIKLFDFGLAKELTSNKDMNEDLFKMSEAGSLRYMAPEIMLGRPYNLKADVYSMSLLLYEILAMKKPYAGFSLEKLFQDAVLDQLRPKVKSSWPLGIRDIIEMSWSDDILERPKMEILQNDIRFHVMEMRGGDVTGLEHTKRRRSMGSIGTVKSSYRKFATM